MKLKLIIILLFLSPVVMGQRVFDVGEKLSYVVNYSTAGIITANVGQVDFALSNAEYQGQEVLKIKAEAYTLPFFRWFFDMLDVYESFVDPQTFKPLYSTAEIKEGHYRFRSALDFNWQEREAISTYGNLKYRTDKHRTMPLSENSFDGLTLFYSLRSGEKEDYTIGKELDLELVLEDTVRHIKYKYLGQDKIKVRPHGRFNALKFSTKLTTSTGESFKEGTTAFVWISDDQNHIPLMVEMPIRVGRVKVKLRKYSSLKYPLDSKIK